MPENKATHFTLPKPSSSQNAQKSGSYLVQTKLNRGISTIRRKKQPTIKHTATLPDHLGPKSWTSGKSQGSNSSPSLASRRIPASIEERFIVLLRWKALTRGKSNFKIKTLTPKGRNFKCCETHLHVRARSVFLFGLHQVRGTLPTVGHISTDNNVNKERTFINVFCRMLLCRQSS